LPNINCCSKNYLPNISSAVQNIFEAYAVYHILFYIHHKTKNLWRGKMKVKDYWGLALLAVFTIAAFIVGITTNNKIVIIAGR